MNSGCVSQATYQALRNRHRREACERLNQDFSHVVVKLQKNGKEVTLTRYDGKSRYETLIEAQQEAARMAALNPTMKFIAR